MALVEFHPTAYEHLAGPAVTFGPYPFVDSLDAGASYIEKPSGTTTLTEFRLLFPTAPLAGVTTVKVQGRRDWDTPDVDLSATITIAAEFEWFSRTTVPLGSVDRGEWVTAEHSVVPVPSLVSGGWVYFGINAEAAGVLARVSSISILKDVASTTTPPLRIFPRSDALAGGAARTLGNSRANQSSNRTIGGHW